MGVGSLVLGIVSLVIAVFFAGFNWLAIILGIIGAVLGAIGRKNVEKKGMATAGLVLSIIAMALGIVFWLACAACAGGLASAVASAAY